MGNTYTNVWEAKTWNGLTNFRSMNVWTDGDNIYYSDHDASDLNYVLDKETSTWSEKTWNGISVLYGSKVWTDGENIYHSNATTHHVLNKATSTWSTKSWSGLTDFDGRKIWTDGDNIYYSSDSPKSQYVLNKSTSTWSPKSWNGLTDFDEREIWKDGNTIYCTVDGNSYILNKSTSTWSEVTWATSKKPFNGAYIWTDGEKIYYGESGEVELVFDSATSTWEDIVWEGYGYVDGRNIWTDGDNIYSSSGNSQYVRVKAASPTANYLSKIVIPVNVSGTISNVEYTFKDAEARQMVTDLGDAVYWIGVATTELANGDTTNPITVDGESITANVGGMASYDGSEFVWNGASWQEIGKNNFGDLAFKDSAEGDFTPVGTVNVTQAADTTTNVTPFGTAGTLPTAYFTHSGENVTFNWNAGTRPTGGSAVTAVTASGTVSATFTGTEGEFTAD